MTVVDLFITIALAVAGAFVVGLYSQVNYLKKYMGDKAADLASLEGKLHNGLNNQRLDFIQLKRDLIWENIKTRDLANSKIQHLTKALGYEWKEEHNAGYVKIVDSKTE